MDRGLSGDDDGVDGPCGELNMIAVSNPCVLDRSLAPKGYIVVHAYGAGNEPYGMWENLERNSQEYKDLKEERAGVLWNAIESIIPDARERTVTSMIGSPLTHERFLRRPRGTYGSATEDYLKDGRTPIKGLVLCGKKLK
jgi:phytoene dehydrogenase-like protein